MILIRAPFSPVNNFWCHPIRRTNHRVSVLLIDRDVRTEAEICQLHFSVHAKKHIVAFDVTMNDLLFVKEGQRFKAPLADAGNLSLCQHRLRDDVGQSAAIKVFHDDPELSANQVALKVVDDVFLASGFHHFNLGDDQLLLRLSV